MTSSETAATLVSNHTGETVESVTAIRSGVNTSYQVTTAESAYFIKFGTENAETILTEAAILQELDGVIPVPHVYLAATTGDSNSFFIADWIEGTENNYNLESGDERLAKEMGAHLAILHTELSFAPGNILGSTGDSLYIDEAEWKQFLESWLYTYAEDVKKNYSGLGSDLVRLVHWCDIPELDGKAVLSPLDYHGGNVLTADGEIAAFIDFERCYSGHPAWSYTISKRIISLHNEALGDYFTTGYETVRELPETAPAFEMAGMIRELRMAHMLFDDLAARRSDYASEIGEIEAQIQKQP